MKQVNLRIYQMILPLILGLFLSVGVYAQNITVRGHVKDAMGEVVGANVIEKVIRRTVPLPIWMVTLRCLFPREQFFRSLSSVIKRQKWQPLLRLSLR